MENERQFFLKKRFGLGFLGLLLCVLGFIAGCDGGTPAPAKPKSMRIGLMITPQGLNDMGFNDLAYAGLVAAAKKFPIDVVLIEPATMKDPEASLRFFAGQTFDAIIAVGMAFHKAIQAISKDHPQLRFFIIDSTIDEGPIKGIAFREDEGSYLCGYLAASMSKTQKVGFIGGVKIEVIQRFLDGFKLGIAAVSTSTRVVEKFIAEDFSGFNRPQIAKELANELYKDGCDIIYHAAGASGLGVIAAAVDAKKFVIGVDMNQDSMAPGLVLTSMLKRVDLVVEDVVKTLAEGKGPETVKRTYGIRDGAIDLTNFQFSRQTIGEPLIKDIQALRKRIAEGQIATRIASGTN